jgi:exodeoxyribonuclease-3
MRIATWNVNSIRVRLEQLSGWLGAAFPDVVCLQETKVEDEKFPEGAIGDMGYRAVFSGQKTYNGVAILARHGLAMEEVKKDLDGDESDVQRRAIACSVDGVRIVNVYVPNGQSVGTPAFAYKLAWLRRLERELAARHSPAEPLVVCGDFNVAPADIDVHDPKRWQGQVLCSPDERAALEHVMSFGLVDTFRERHPGEGGLFSWWDYRMGGFRRNQGLRIDLALCTRPLLERCRSATIDLAPRKLDKPSDHAPLVIEIDG